MSETKRNLDEYYTDDGIISVEYLLQVKKTVNTNRVFLVFCCTKFSVNVSCTCFSRVCLLFTINLGEYSFTSTLYKKGKKLKQ